MALSSTSKLLIKTTYKALLKSAKRLDAVVPAGAAVDRVLAQLRAPVSVSFYESARLAFRRLPAPTYATGIDAAFAVLREANKVASAFEAPPAPASAARFRVGQVFRHRQHGYRAIVVSRDESCKASARWAAATGAARLPRGTDQPFYTCLVDMRDRPDAAVTYVAEDNVEALESGDDATLVHPLLARHFVVAGRTASAPSGLLQEALGDGELPFGAGSSRAMAV